MTLDELQQCSIAILGFGVEGQGTYSFLRHHFPHKQLAIADKRAIRETTLPEPVAEMVAHDTNLQFYAGDDYLSCLSVSQLVIKSPGIPPSLPELIQFKGQGGIITSHLEIFLDLAGTENVIGITGTKGKSTTASLIYHLLRDAGVESVLAGNIGSPPLEKLDVMQAGRCKWVVECSSYQLAQLHRSPHVAVLLGVVPEHLGVHDPSQLYAHHRDFASYAAAKETITCYQGPEGVLIFNADDEVATQIALRSRARLHPVSQRDEPSNGSFLRDGKLMYSKHGVAEEVIDVDQIPLLGKFNQINVMAAIAAASEAGAPRKGMRRSIMTFRGLPHRLEFIGEAAGIMFYDDSISTVPQAAISALDALGDRVATVILGGHDRGADYSELATALIKKRVSNVILFSPSGLRIWEGVEKSRAYDGTCPTPHFVTNMQMAVDVALACTAPGSICLLSPASASYGMFKNFEERGAAFRKAIPFN